MMQARYSTEDQPEDQCVAQPGFQSADDRSDHACHQTGHQASKDSYSKSMAC
jgi:hypothetical protein